MIWSSLAKKYINAEMNADINTISALVGDELVFNGINFLKDEFISLPRDPIKNSIKFIDCCYRDKYICCEYEVAENTESLYLKFVMIIKFNDFGKINYVQEYSELLEQ